ncbi:MAG: bifunctional oligoribonuclease/PAP phosphatase NrnA [Clostridia bacterium]|nr:bifunctional oligoribonuclease/PAP phosphatase NrnA [Clostridia bacterium]
MNLIDSIKSAKNILIVGHVRPDGDCLGAGLALKRLANNEGARADLVYDSDLPKHYEFMQGFDTINKPTSENYDLLIVVDCGDELRMGKYAKLLKKIKSIQFDHHITNKGFAQTNYIYPEKSSTCEIIADVLLPLNKVDSVIADCLYVGLSTDSGHFMHNNVTSNVFDVATKLMNCGLNAYELNMRLYRNRTVKKTELIARALNSMKYFRDDSICIITVKSSDLTETGCTLSDTEGLIDFAMAMGCVKVAVCMTEQSEHKYKVSFRSKGYNVSECAAVFGGGGHVQAAGCVVCGYYEDVLRKIVKSITD